ncbi:MAG: DUF4124 domain-containing protein [Porticoccaceae bacterium]
MSNGFNWLILPLCLILGMSPGLAAVYKTVDEKGNVTYTDTPPSDDGNAEPVKLPPINTQPALETRQTTPKQSEDMEGYEEVAILAPAQDATIPPGQINVVVQVFLEPALKPGHLILLLHNGQPSGEPSFGPSFSIDSLIRGEHTLQAQVVNETGAVIAQSSTITIHVKRHSPLNKDAIQTQNTERAKRVKQATQGAN